MLDAQMLQDMPSSTVFARGEVENSPEGIFMTSAGGELRWLAVRGNGYPDWTIYCHWISTAWHDIADFGDKIGNEKHIKKLVPCDDEAYKMYRR